MGAKLSRRRLLAGGAAALFAAALPAGQRAHAAELTDILWSRKIRAVVPDFESPPFFSSQGGRLNGIDIDILRELASALGGEVVFDRAPKTFNEAVAVLANGDADIAVCKLSRTLNRGRIIRYSQPYARLNHGLILNRVRFADMARGREAEEVIRGFEGDLGVIANSSFAEFAPRNFPKARIREFESWPRLGEAIRAGHVDAAYRDEFEIKKLLVDDPSLTIVARSVSLTDLTDTIGIGIGPRAPDLAAYVDLFLSLTNRSRPLSADEIIARYGAGGHRAG